MFKWGFSSCVLLFCIICCQPKPVFLDSSFCFVSQHLFKSTPPCHVSTLPGSAHWEQSDEADSCMSGKNKKLFRTILWTLYKQRIIDLGLVHLKIKTSQNIWPGRYFVLYSATTIRSTIQSKSYHNCPKGLTTRTKLTRMAIHPAIIHIALAFLLLRKPITW